MTATDRDRATAEDVVRAEWLHAVDTGAIIDYGSQDAVHAAMDHMADAFAAALATERERVLAPVLARINAAYALFCPNPCCTSTERIFR